MRDETRLAVLAVWRGFLSFYQSNDLTFASSIAYYTLLSLFPFFLLVLAVLGSVTSAPSDRLAIVNWVLRYFPRQFEFVTTQLDALEQSRVRLGVAGSLLMIWAAMGAFSAISNAVNRVWGVEKQPSYLKHKMMAFVMLVASTVLLLVGLLLVSVANIVGTNWFAAMLARMPGLLILEHLAVAWSSTVVLILVVGLILYFVPNASVRFRDVWFGAVLTGLLWRLALFGFSWYVRDMSRLRNVDGSIAAVVVFLVWVYTTAVLLLYGVEVTAAYARLRRHRPEEIPAAPAPRV